MRAHTYSLIQKRRSDVGAWFTGSRRRRWRGGGRGGGGGGKPRAGRFPRPTPASRNCHFKPLEAHMFRMSLKCTHRWLEAARGLAALKEGEAAAAAAAAAGAMPALRRLGDARYIAVRELLSSIRTHVQYYADTSSMRTHVQYYADTSIGEHRGAYVTLHVRHTLLRVSC
jgi:hypothetical protein